jgi:hypothetical protein
MVLLVPEVDIYEIGIIVFFFSKKFRIFLTNKRITTKKTKHKQKIDTIFWILFWHELFLGSFSSCTLDYIHVL